MIIHLRQSAKVNAKMRLPLRQKFTQSKQTLVLRPSKFHKKNNTQGSDRRCQRTKVVYKVSWWDCADFEDRRTEHFKALPRQEHPNPNPNLYFSKFGKTRFYIWE